MAYKRKQLTPFNVFLSTIQQAGGSLVTVLPAADYYVATYGDDVTGNGTSSAPYLTLERAATQVSGTGKTCYVVPGKYPIANSFAWPVGISVFGAADLSSKLIAYTAMSASGIFNMRTSYTDGVGSPADGSQSISYLSFDGNARRCVQAIFIQGRSNVSVHHCDFKDFADAGVTFNGRGDDSPALGFEAPPSVFCEDNTFHNNTMVNCSGSTGSFGNGSLRVGGQLRFLCYSNYINETSRVGRTHNGYCVKLYRRGYLQDCKFYNNVFIRDVTNHVFDFSMELWNLRGVEIYNNVCRGAIDLDNFQKGIYAYGVDIHHNDLGYDTLSTSPYAAIISESTNYVDEPLSWRTGNDLIIRNNKIKNALYAIKYIKHFDGNVYDDHKIYNNILIDSQLFTWNLGANVTVSNLAIYNNTITTTLGTGFGATYLMMDAIQFTVTGTTYSNVTINNNIISGFNRSGLFSWGAANVMPIASYRNNIVAYCGNSNAPVSSDGSSFTFTLNSGNLLSASQAYPNFVNQAAGDLRIATGSPAINAGIANGLTTDYADVTRTGNPDIGAYEFI
jgi:hypothetical protein